MKYHNVKKMRMCILWKTEIWYKNYINFINRIDNQTEIVIRAFYYIALDKLKRSDVNLV